MSMCFPGNFRVNADVCLLKLGEVVDKLLSLATPPPPGSTDVVCVQKLWKTPHYFPNYTYFCTSNRRSSDSKDIICNTPKFRWFRSTVKPHATFLYALCTTGIKGTHEGQSYLPLFICPQVTVEQISTNVVPGTTGILIAIG
jgi:hypothetical protein